MAWVSTTLLLSQEKSFQERAEQNKNISRRTIKFMLNVIDNLLLNRV
jgi:molecular chaperone GrpE (heat shock protein)